MHEETSRARSLADLLLDALHILGVFALSRSLPRLLHVAEAWVASKNYAAVQRNLNDITSRNNPVGNGIFHTFPEALVARIHDVLIDTGAAHRRTAGGRNLGHSDGAHQRDQRRHGNEPRGHCSCHDQIDEGYG